MASYMPLIEKMIISSMTGSHSSPRLVTPERILTALSLVLISTGLVFGLYAEYIWLKTFLLPHVAALIVSGSAFVLALVFIAIGKDMYKANEKKMTAGHSGDVTKVIRQIMESLGAELEQPVRENPKTAMMLASLAGFAAAEKRI